MSHRYEPTLTMREARAQYFRDNDFGEDGGYADAWVDFSLGPIPFPFPNTPMRREAVGYHDLHHVLTGYRTDLRGELEIAAWEIGAGCRTFVVAWQLDLSGLAAGVLLAPRRVFDAFVRGRRSHSLYGEPLEELLELTVEEARERLSVPTESPGATMADGLLFALAAAAGAVVGSATFVLGLFTLPVAYVVFSRRRRLET